MASSKNPTLIQTQILTVSQPTKNDTVLSTIQLKTKLTSDTSRTQYHSAGTKGVDLLARQNI